MAVGEVEAVLVTMSCSHFCELARWALERYSVPFTEEAHAPGFHRKALRQHGSSKETTPCLVLAGGGAEEATVVEDSIAILEWVDQRALARPRGARGDPLPRLFPPALEPQVSTLCTDFDARLGPATRRWFYSHMLHLPCAFALMTGPTVPAQECQALSGSWTLTRQRMAQYMDISPETGMAALAEMRSVLREVSDLLSDGRQYLTGDALTAADLSFATLAAPAVAQLFGVHKGLSESLPAEMRAQIEEMRETPAGQFVLRLWQEERTRVLV